MKKSKKVLSALLAMIMLFSCISVGVQAVYNPYKDSGITSYDELDQPILTTEQYGSMALDEIDRMLAAANIRKSIELGTFAFTIDLTSFDKALASIRDAWNMVKGAQGFMGGDIAKLDMSAIEFDCPGRTTGGKTDVDIIYCLLDFLSDNSAIIAKVANNTLDLGTLKTLVNLDIDLQQMIKEILFKMAYPKTDVPKNITLTVDQILQDVIDNLLRGEIDPITGKSTGLLPELAGVIDINKTSFYDMVEKAIRVLWNGKVNELLNTTLKKRVRELCGVDYTDLTLPDGDASKLNEYAKLIDINYVIPKTDFSAYAPNESIIDHANDILGSILKSVAKFEINWVAGSNSNLMTNIVTVGKEIIKKTGSAFFADYVVVKTPAEIDAMTDMQFVSYLVRAIVNGSESNIYVPENCDTLRKIAVYSASVIVGDLIPEMYNTYKSLPLDDTNSLKEMLGDVIVYLMKQYTTIELYYTDTFDDVITYVVDWALGKYGGLIGDSTGTGWAFINKTIFSVIPANWLPLKNGAPRNDVYDIVFNDVLNNIFDLNINGLISLMARNTSSDAQLNKPVTFVLVNLVKNVINLILPATATANYTTFESLISKANLPTLVNNLISNLSKNARRLMPSLLPLVCQLLDLSGVQEFGFPYISLENQINTAIPADKTFYIYNESAGLNTAARNVNDQVKQDMLYKYKINSVKTNQANVTVTYAKDPGKSYLTINGGESANFTIAGTPAANQTLIVYVDYDVLDEFGAAMTSSSIVATAVTFVSSIVDDGSADGKVNIDVNANTHSGTYVKATYLSQNKKLVDLNDYAITIKRAADDKKDTLPATISLASATLDSKWAGTKVSANTLANISTTSNGGNWSINPYKVQPEPVKPPTPPTTPPTPPAPPVPPATPGLYTSYFDYNTTATNGTLTEKLPFTHYVYVYNDFDLPSLLNSAVSSNRQQSQYGAGDFSYSYIDVDGIKQTEIVNGAEAWNNYISAITNAASVAYRPRNINTFANTHVKFYEQYATELKDAIARLEACAVTSGTSSLQAAVDMYAPSNTKIDPITQKEVPMKYAEPGYKFIDRCDYKAYTYNRYKPEKKAARSIIDNQKSLNPRSYSAIELAYAEHRLVLYSQRLLRIPALKVALEDAIARVNAAGYVEQKYTAKSWKEYKTAYDFALATVAESLGNVNASGYLTGEGLRQSKVNAARAGLVEASKRLVSSADYTAFNVQMAKAAGYTNPALYTPTTWATFTTALTAAKALRLDLVATVDNQKLIDNTTLALKNAIDGLLQKADYAQLDATIVTAKTYVPNQSQYTVASYAAFDTALKAAQAVSRDLTSTGQSIINKAQQDLTAAIAGLVKNVTDVPTVDFAGNIKKSDLYDAATDKLQIIGLDWWDMSVSAYATAKGGATFQVTPNALGSESTGCLVDIFDKDGTPLQSFEVVTFGDIDGNAQVDFDDYLEFDRFSNGKGTLYDSSYGLADYSACGRAADINADGSIDAFDISVLTNAVYSLGEVVQNYDSTNFYISY